VTDRNRARGSSAVSCKVQAIQIQLFSYVIHYQDDIYLINCYSSDLHLQRMTWPSLVSFPFDRGFKDVFNSKTDRRSGISDQRRDASSLSHDWTKIFLGIRVVRFLVRTQERRWRKWYVKNEFGISWSFHCSLRCNAAAVR
jgi:hypothetical protein